MPWWGGGSSDDDTSGPSSKTFADESEIAYAAPQGGGMNVGGGASDIQQFASQMQQQMMIQTVITALSDTAFKKCITGKPSDSMSGSQVACVHSTVNKWMDTNEFMMGRLAKKEQAMQQAAGGGY